jgi:amidophosphoribosyltransferase
VLLVDDSVVRGTTSQQIIQMAREAGARRVYFASAAPPVRYPNVYGIDMPCASELIAHGRSEDKVCRLLGADGLLYQDLDELIDAVQKKGKSYVDRFDASVFNGDYITGDVTDTYLHQLEENRNDSAKEVQVGYGESVIELYNSA